MALPATPVPPGTTLYYTLWALTRLGQWCAGVAAELDGTLEVFEEAERVGIAQNGAQAASRTPTACLGVYDVTVRL